MAADALSRVFSALADPTRRDMVARLATGDATVTELAAHYPVSVQAVSKHLKVLHEAGVVSRSRQAQCRPVHLEAQVLDLMTKWIERYRAAAQERYVRLDQVLAALQAGPGPSAPGDATPEAQQSTVGAPPTRRAQREPNNDQQDDRRHLSRS